MEKGIKFVYSDFGGVMVEIKKPLLALVDKLGVDETKFIELWKPLDDAACRGDITPEHMWRVILQKIGYSGGPLDLTKEWVKGFEINYPVHQLLLNLNKTCAIGILSNLYPGLYPEVVRRGLIPNINYAAVVLSSDEREIKPVVRMFEIAEERTGKKTDQILLLDDLQENVDVARSRGWTGVLYDSRNPQEAIDEVLRLTLSL